MEGWDWRDRIFRTHIKICLCEESEARVKSLGERPQRTAYRTPRERERRKRQIRTRREEEDVKMAHRCKYPKMPRKRQAPEWESNSEGASLD